MSTVLSKRALHAAVKEVITSWHPSLQKIVDEADLSTIFSVGLRSAEPVKAWQTTPVTLLGDAIHSRIPFRGMGANTALRDAGLLCQQLLGVATKEVPLLQAVAEYETEMLHYG
ncbi:MAG TPA: FAD-dependent monooxygenase, partial [Ktedonobacteraceae bacterium]